MSAAGNLDPKTVEAMLVLTDSMKMSFDVPPVSDFKNRANTAKDLGELIIACCTVEFYSPTVTLSWNEKTGMLELQFEKVEFEGG